MMRAIISGPDSIQPTSTTGDSSAARQSRALHTIAVIQKHWRAGLCPADERHRGNELAFERKFRTFSKIAGKKRKGGSSHRSRTVVAAVRGHCTNTVLDRCKPTNNAFDVIRFYLLSCYP
jgi:hypothetical protein